MVRLPEMEENCLQWQDIKTGKICMGKSCMKKIANVYLTVTVAKRSFEIGGKQGRNYIQ